MVVTQVCVCARLSDVVATNHVSERDRLQELVSRGTKLQVNSELLSTARKTLSDMQTRIDVETTLQKAVQAAEEVLLTAALQQAKDVRTKYPTFCEDLVARAQHLLSRIHAEHAAITVVKAALADGCLTPVLLPGVPFHSDDILNGSTGTLSVSSLRIGMLEAAVRDLQAMSPASAAGRAILFDAQLVLNLRSILGDILQASGPERAQYWWSLGRMLKVEDTMAATDRSLGDPNARAEVGCFRNLFTNRASCARN